MHYGLVAQVDVVWALDLSRLLRVFFIVCGVLRVSSGKEVGDLVMGAFYGLGSIVGTKFDNRTNSFHPQLERCWDFLLFSFDGLRQEIAVGG
jgi:hypothetical protein